MRFSLLHTIASLLYFSVFAGVYGTAPLTFAAAAPPIQHSEYSGSLIQPGKGDGEILRRFEVQLFSSDGSHFFHVADDVRQGCPWPDSFGVTGTAVSPEKVQPHLIYPYDGNTYFIVLPPLLISFPENTEPGSTWNQAGWQMTTLARKNLNGTEVWEVEAREPRGRRQTILADAVSGILVRAESDVFMGQGDQFLLTLERSATSVLADAISQTVKDLQSELLKLQGELNRRADAQLAELSERQVNDTVATLETLTKLATGTPLERLVRQIRSDSEQQKKRLETVAGQASSVMNSAAPAFSLNLVSGGTLKSESLQGKTIVLHFWDYRDAPLSEPYGQTGYLEFLFNQRKSRNVQVIGVSTNQDLQNPENQNRGRRAARKLSEFMNLSYPIGYDDGALLKSLGDPRDSRGQLPLWLVINPEGKVIHYHAGFYEIDVTKGLSELDTAILKAIGK